jgi:hypothetical protein
MAGVASLVQGQRLTINKTYIYINVVVLEYICSIATILIYLCHVVMLMPTITIYLTNELYDKVRDAPSKTVRAALEYYFENTDASEKDPGRPKQSATKHTETEIVPKKK